MLNELSNGRPTVRFTAETRELHARLSATSGKFLDFVERTPACLSRGEFAALSRGDGPYDHVLQAWPTFVNRRRVDEMAGAAIGLSRLVTGLCTRHFERDPARLAAFYGLGLEQAAQIAAAAAAPGWLDGVIARGDFLDTSGGLKCTELNLGGNLGGWQSRMWAPRFERVPVLRRFCAEHGVRWSSRDTLRLFFLHALEPVLGGARPADGVWNLALLISPEYRTAAAMQAYLEAELRRLLAEAAPDLDGRVFLCRDEQLREADGWLWLGDRRIHALAEQFPVEFDARLFACLAAGGTRLFNGPVRLILDDKRNLALLSEQLETSLLSEEERRLVAAHVPWTRRVHAGDERFGGEVVRLPELLAARREQVVLKRAVSYGGADVHLGCDLAAGRWEELVRRALEEGDWVAQERVEPVPYVYQAGACGCAPFDVVWGLFVFGRTYGGAFVRMLPKRRGGVINTTRGATEGIVLEVEE